MFVSRKSLFTFLLLLVLVAPVAAQFGPVAMPQGGVPLFQNPGFNPGLGGGLPNQNVGRILNTPIVPTVGFGVSGFSAVPNTPFTSPFPSSPYSTFIIPGPGDFYRGVGDLTLAYGRYVQDYQRGRLLNQEVERSMIDTRRRLYDEWRYYESLKPTAEDVRVARLEGDLKRARFHAPTGEILAGRSLNDLLRILKDASAKGKRGPALSLDQDLLKRINVTPKEGVNIGLIKTGKVNWPLVLKDERFGKIRDKLDQNLENAVNRAKLNGNVDAALLNELINLRRDLDDQLDRVAPTLTISQFMEAKRHLNWLGDGLRALEGADVANFFNQKYEARGKTVGDLVEYMTLQGLQFAPALPGDDPSYRTLYNYLVAYDNAVQLVGSR